MRVQQRVEFAGTGVNELSRNQIASDTVALVALFADSGGREGIQFAERNARCLLVRCDQPLVLNGPCGILAQHCSAGGLRSFRSGLCVPRQTA